ncbi:MAG: ABC transporter ATP-binding protein [Candidatus Limnocylindria bacterium]|nr:ABC transporter ATP-binding protein [Candidatus Limnocylindria bacterium]
MLSVANLEVVYSDVIVGLRGLSLEVPERGIVALLGANGAGKTTCLRAITGLLDVHRGRISKGTVSYRGERIDHLDAPEIVRRGIAQVLEGRRICAELTVDENLRAGAYSGRDGAAAVRRSYERVLELFPVLKQRHDRIAGYLSGGEQQMLAIGRALMAEPRLLLLDEPSLGLAPLLVQQIREVIVDINRRGTAVLLVEQNAAMALAIASHGYVLETGKVVMDKPADVLARDPDVREFYLGFTEGRKRSYREVRHYRRRKRWLS